MRTRPVAAPAFWALSFGVLVAACGIPTSQPGGLGDEIEQAAIETSELEAYQFTWTADYLLSDPDTGRPELVVTGAGAVDVATRDLESVVTYDESLRSAAEALFPDDEIGDVTAYTTIAGDDVYIRGFNAASLPAETPPSYDTWYRITERRQDLGDPFVQSGVLPVDVLTVLVEPLVDAGELSVAVDRDFVLDLGTRFSRSLYDFGLRIGGGDFQLSIELTDGLIRSVVLDGDDPEAGVERFTFEITYLPVDAVVVTAPADAVPLP
jgi:hypothetical protein